MDIVAAGQLTRGKRESPRIATSGPDVLGFVFCTEFFNQFFRSKSVRNRIGHFVGIRNGDTASLARGFQSGTTGCRRGQILGQDSLFHCVFGWRGMLSRQSSIRSNSCGTVEKKSENSERPYYWCIQNLHHQTHHREARRRAAQNNPDRIKIRGKINRKKTKREKRLNSPALSVV